MKKILMVAATEMEIKLLINECTFLGAGGDHLRSYLFRDLEFDLLITGIGTTFTTFFLTQTLLSGAYELVLDTGIAGSLNGQYDIGEVVNVVEEEFADLGIEKEQEFLTLFDSGFLQPDEFPFENRALRADGIRWEPDLPKVRGITSNTSHGREITINELKSRFPAQIITMEGAAVFYVCRWMGVPCLQIRSVSNLVVPRNLSRWDIPLALENLKNELVKVLENLSASEH